MGKALERLRQEGAREEARTLNRQTLPAYHSPWADNREGSTAVRRKDSEIRSGRTRNLGFSLRLQDYCLFDFWLHWGRDFKLIWQEVRQLNKWPALQR